MHPADMTRQLKAHLSQHKTCSSQNSAAHMTPSSAIRCPFPFPFPIPLPPRKRAPLSWLGSHGVLLINSFPKPSPAHAGRLGQIRTKQRRLPLRRPSLFLLFPQTLPREDEERRRRGRRSSKGGHVAFHSQTRTARALRPLRPTACACAYASEERNMGVRRTD